MEFTLSFNGKRIDPSDWKSTLKVSLLIQIIALSMIISSIWITVSRTETKINCDKNQDKCIIIETNLFTSKTTKIDEFILSDIESAKLTSREETVQKEGQRNTYIMYSVLLKTKNSQRYLSNFSSSSYMENEIKVTKLNNFLDSNQPTLTIIEGYVLPWFFPLFFAIPGLIFSFISFFVIKKALLVRKTQHLKNNIENMNNT